MVQQLEWRIETVRDVEIPIPFKANTKGWLKFIPDEKIEEEKNETNSAMVQQEKGYNSREGG